MRALIFVLLPLIAGAAPLLRAGPTPAPKIPRHHGPCTGTIASMRCKTCEWCSYCGKKGRNGKRPENSATCPACRSGAPPL